ncbi:hypothetical protein GEMRC1_012938 [Eukaryota sp. GEM-RC1]
MSLIRFRGCSIETMYFCQPFWTAYAFQLIVLGCSENSFVHNVIIEIGVKVKSVLSRGPFNEVPKNALNCNLGQSGGIASNLVAESVEHQFSILKSGELLSEYDTFFFGSLVLIDPLVMAYCWSYVFEHTKEDDSVFAKLLQLHLCTNLSKHVTPQFFGLLIEPCVSAFLIFLLRMNASLIVSPESVLGFLKPVSNHQAFRFM